MTAANVNETVTTYISEHVTEPRPAALGTEAAATYLGVTAGYLRKLRARHEGPAYVALGTSTKSKVLYRINDLDAWLKALRVDPSNGGDAA